MDKIKTDSLRECKMKCVRENECGAINYDAENQGCTRFLKNTTDCKVLTEASGFIHMVFFKDNERSGRSVDECVNWVPKQKFDDINWTRSVWESHPDAVNYPNRAQFAVRVVP